MRNTHCALEHHQVTLLCPGASRSGHRGQSDWPLPRATSPSAHLPGPPAEPLGFGDCALPVCGFALCSPICCPPFPPHLALGGLIPVRVRLQCPLGLLAGVQLQEHAQVGRTTPSEAVDSTGACPLVHTSVSLWFLLGRGVARSGARCTCNTMRFSLRTCLSQLVLRNRTPRTGSSHCWSAFSPPGGGRWPLRCLQILLTVSSCGRERGLPISSCKGTDPIMGALPSQPLHGLSGLHTNLGTSALSP